MSTATVRSVDAHVTAIALLVGEDADARRRARQILDDQGFRTSTEQTARQLGPASVIVHFGVGTETDHLHSLRNLHKRRPDCPIIAVVPSTWPSASLRRVLLAGARGIVLEDEMAATLAPTAHAVRSGQLTVPQSLGRQVAPQPLSHREKQILALVMRGLTNRAIAQELFLAESTVKTHLSSAFRKIDARSRSEAVAKIQDPETGYGTHILHVDASRAPSV